MIFLSPNTVKISPFFNLFPLAFLFNKSYYFPNKTITHIFASRKFTPDLRIENFWKMFASFVQKFNRISGYPASRLFVILAEVRRIRLDTQGTKLVVLPYTDRKKIILQIKLEKINFNSKIMYVSGYAWECWASVWWGRGTPRQSWGRTIASWENNYRVTSYIWPCVSVLFKTWLLWYSYLIWRLMLSWFQSYN